VFLIAALCIQCQTAYDINQRAHAYTPCWNISRHHDYAPICIAFSTGFWKQALRWKFGEKGIACVSCRSGRENWTCSSHIRISSGVNGKTWCIGIGRISGVPDLP